MKKLASLAVVVSLASAGLISPALTARADDGTTTSTTTTVDPATETLQQRAERIIALYPNAPEDAKAKVRELAAKLPADFHQKAAALNAKLGIDDTQAAEVANSVINPGDYQCQDTPLSTWMLSSVKNWGIGELLLFAFVPEFANLPTYDALLFGSESKLNKFGINGEYTSLLTSEMTDLRKFWDFDGSKIQLIPMHGADVWTSVDRVARTLAYLQNTTVEAALPTAAVFKDIVDNFAPSWQKGAAPIFTFNAFAVDPSTEVGLEGLSKRIIVGDGVLQGYEGIGIDSRVAPRAILAHEYGHQLQYAKGLFATTLTGPEATRRTELMADAFGSYFMVHSQGEALNKARTLADQKTFYNVGDCGFDSDGHHGTPNQRYNTASWAIGIANSAADQGHKLGGVAFDNLFEAKLPALVAPDAN